MTDTTQTEQQEDRFNSVILTVDHTTEVRRSGHLIQKFVASTEDLVTSMVALTEYYEETHLLNSAATIRQFQQAALSQFPCFTYRTKENLQIVMSAETFSMLCLRAGGDVFQATQLILDTAGKVVSEYEAAAGGVMPLILFTFDTVDPDAPAAEASAQPAPVKRTRATK